MQWRCAAGHDWSATYHSVVDDGTWCPICTTWKSEEECRRILETYSGYSFPKARPSWLSIGEGGSPLELDGYNVELEVAFEYHGIQHREYTPFFHRRGPADLEAQRERDAAKLAACNERGVLLMVFWFDSDLAIAVPERWDSL
jgi:hypothetical protein